MKPEQLRIGNLVNVDNIEYHPEITIDKTPMKIVGICMGNDGYSVQLNTLDITKQDVSPFVSQYSKFIIPIELTEEWLIKFGFNKYNNFVLDSYSIKLNGIGVKSLCITIEQGNQYITLREFNYASETIPSDLVVLRNSDYHGEFYVHQLQNLYFALTNKELEFKL